MDMDMGMEGILPVYLLLLLDLRLAVEAAAVAETRFRPPQITLTAIHSTTLPLLLVLLAIRLLLHIPQPVGTPVHIPLTLTFTLTILLLLHLFPPLSPISPPPHLLFIQQQMAERVAEGHRYHHHHRHYQQAYQDSDLEGGWG